MMDLTKEEAAALVCELDNRWACERCPAFRPSKTMHGLMQCYMADEEKKALAAKLKAYIDQSDISDKEDETRL